MKCEDVVKGLKILYVEDEDEIRELMYDVLAEDFSLFETARDGQEGLAKFIAGDYDCVITDIQMPGMDGLELAQRVKKIKNIPVILLTAYSEKERLFKAIDVGVSKYLVKPFTPEKLLDVLCEIFKQEDLIYLGRDIFYHKSKGEIKRGEEMSKLTKKEKILLDLLLQSPDKIVSVEKIEQAIWPEGDFSQNALRTLVKRLRKKTDKALIENFSGLGYKIILNNS